MTRPWSLVEPTTLLSCALQPRIETINLQKDVSDNYSELADTLKAKWEARLAKAASRHAPQVPDTRAWNDSWYGWKK